MKKRRTLEIPVLPFLILFIFLLFLIRICFIQVEAKVPYNTAEEQTEIVETPENIVNTIQNQELIDYDYIRMVEEEVIDEDVEVIEEPIISQEQVMQEQTQAQVSPISQTPRPINPVYHKTKSGVVYYTIGQVNIPKVSINYPIISETSETLMKLGITKYWGPNPNEIGNMCLVGHNYRNDGKYFSKLHYVTNGDIIYITDLYGLTYKYVVYKTMVVDPYDTSCTSQLTDGKQEITLITCYNQGTQRYVVKAAAQ